MSNQSTDLRLLRAIPAHTETFRFRWLQRNFTVVDETYRHIRRKVGGTMLQCDWCNRKFDDGENLHLAQPETGRNWAVCSKCADEMEHPP